MRALTPWRSVEQVRSSLVHSVGRTANGRWSWKYDTAISTLHSSYGDPSSRWTALERIEAPTLLVRGEDSDITDAGIVERMAGLIPSSQIASVPDAGHRVAGDNPSEFNSVLRRFLSSLPERAGRVEDS